MIAAKGLVGPWDIGWAGHCLGPARDPFARAGPARRDTHNTVHNSFVTLSAGMATITSAEFRGFRRFETAKQLPTSTEDGRTPSRQQHVRV
jgi:hypothetical protein